MSRTDRPSVRALAWSGFAFVILFALGWIAGRLAGAHREPSPDTFDARVTSRIVALRSQWPGATDVFRAVTRFGDFEVGLAATVVVAVTLAWLARRRIAGVDRRDVVLWIFVILGSRLLSVGLKGTIARERPPLDVRLVPENSHSFPSSHALGAAAFLTMIALLGTRILRAHQGPRWIGHLLVILCLALGGVIVASRVWLGVHYVSDVVFGSVLGVLWAVAAWTIRERTWPVTSATTANRAP